MAPSSRLTLPDYGRDLFAEPTAPENEEDGDFESDDDVVDAEEFEQPRLYLREEVDLGPSFTVESRPAHIRTAFRQHKRKWKLRPAQLPVQHPATATATATATKRARQSLGESTVIENDAEGSVSQSRRTVSGGDEKQKKNDAVDKRTKHGELLSNIDRALEARELRKAGLPPFVVVGRPNKQGRQIGIDGQKQTGIETTAWAGRDIEGWRQDEKYSKGEALLWYTIHRIYTTKRHVNNSAREQVRGLGSASVAGIKPPVDKAIADAKKQRPTGSVAINAPDVLWYGRVLQICAYSSGISAHLNLAVFYLHTFKGFSDPTSPHGECMQQLCRPSLQKNRRCGRGGTYNRVRC